MDQACFTNHLMYNDEDKSFSIISFSRRYILEIWIYWKSSVN